MDIFKIDYHVVSVKKDDDKWVFETKEGEQICFPAAYISKNPTLPKKSFWQKSILTVGYIAGEAVAAWVDNLELFVLNEKDYSQKVALQVARAKSLEEQEKKRFALEDEQIKEDIGKYLENFSYPTALNEHLIELPIILRAPLKALFLFGCTQSLADESFDKNNFEKRLYLNFVLFKIVANFYENVTSADSFLGTTFGLMYFSKPVPETYHTDVELLQKSTDPSKLTEDLSLAYKPYYDIRNVLKNCLPKIESVLLERYFIFLVQNWLFSYAQAFYDFEDNSVRTGFCRARVLSDEDEYKQQHRNGLLTFDIRSFIVPEVASDDFDYFLLNASLK